MTERARLVERMQKHGDNSTSIKTAAYRCAYGSLTAGLPSQALTRQLSQRESHNYSSGIPAFSQASRVAVSQTLAWTSPMWALPSSSIHRRLWPMPPPMV
mgnify:CR=1 FL=1